MWKYVRMAVLVGATCDFLAQAQPTPPRAGKVGIFKTSELKPGMKGTAWTVFSGSTPEPIPVEILGLWKNAWGPRQDIILARLGGKAKITNVAGGMSGSPVYIDGRLVGAVALRLSIFSSEAICGITPAELMMEISDFDTSRPDEARTPDKAQPRAQMNLPAGLLPAAVSAGFPGQDLTMVPIETPLTFSGFHENVLAEFRPLFQQLGLTAAQGGASGAITGPAPASGWEKSLQPGDAVAGVLVTGDMSITALGTVTANDGRRVLAFGHPLFNLGPVSMPMSKGEVLMVLPSSYQPNKFANATEIVGALHQDRHSGIMGVLGEAANMITVSVRVRSFDDNNTLRKEKQFHFQVFVEQKWTPYLMMFTLFNSISGLNDFAEEATYRLSGKVELAGQPDIRIPTMQAPGDMPIPASILLAGYWGDKFNRLFLNNVKTPRLRSVEASIDLLPRRRVASIETAWVARTEVEPGEEVPIKVFLRPYRGDRIARSFRLRLPAALHKGEHRILLSDADTLNRAETAAGLMNRYIDLPQTVALMNRERRNNQLYVSLVEARPTVYYDDKTLPGLPASVLNVMQAGRSANRALIASAETPIEQTAIPFDLVVTGSFSLRITVK